MKTKTQVLLQTKQLVKTDNCAKYSKQLLSFVHSLVRINYYLMLLRFEFDAQLSPNNKDWQIQICKKLQIGTQFYSTSFAVVSFLPFSLTFEKSFVGIIFVLVIT